jgi:hypothetical protein
MIRHPADLKKMGIGS